MQQIVSARALIQQKNKVLLVRRSKGRMSYRGLYELPGATIDSGDSIDNQLKKFLQVELGVSPSPLKLQTVSLGYDAERPDRQLVGVVYATSVSGEKIELSEKYNRYIWADASKIQQTDLTPLTQAIIAEVVDLSTAGAMSAPGDESRVTIYADGGSRGNPGHSAAGFVLYSQDNQVVYEGGEYLGITTNNQAEYHGVRLGLEKAAELGYRKVDFKLDSLLVVNQMKGIYKIKNRDLWPINERIKELIGRFEKVSFSHVRREFNQHADSLVNQVLDSHRQ